MESVLNDSLTVFAAAVEKSSVAQALRFSRWGYSLVNTGHVLSLAVLVGSILALDLRLLGVWGRLDRTDVVRMLAPLAALGLLSAMATGSLLFAIRARDYIQTPLFLWKLGLILIGVSLALSFHAKTGLWGERASPRLAAVHGAASLVCWLGALVCGRMIAYFPG